MSVLQLRNLPDGVKRALRKRARDEGVSMSDFVLRLIREALDRPRPEEILRALEALPKARDSTPASDLLDEARREVGTSG